MDRSSTSRLLLPIAMLSIIVGVSAGPSLADETRPERRDPLINEQTGISLKLIDVSVLDDDGNPIPDLVAQDFDLSLNTRLQKIYAVENFCSEASGAPVIRFSVYRPRIPPAAMARTGR